MERRQGRWFAGAWVVVFGAGFVAGCTEPAKDKLSLLTDENDRLMKELESARAELVTAQDEIGRHQRQNRTLAEQLDAYRGKLESMPNPPADWRGVPGGAMTSIAGSLLFDSGKATLRSGSTSKLDTVARTITEQFANKDIFVFGHTDAQPILHSQWRDNRQLSFERAAAVIAYLVQRGLDPSRVLAVGAGEHRPIVEGVTAEQRNRRVEIYAVTTDFAPASGGLNP